MAISSNATGLRPGVCTSTTRPTTPYTGQIIYETDTGYLRVWDGSAWDYLSQKQDNTVGLGPVGGLVLIKTQTVGSSVATVTVSDAFNSSFDNYKITWTGGTTSGNVDIGMQLGSSTSTYAYQVIYAGYASVTPSGAGTTSAAGWATIGGSSTNVGQVIVDVLQPFLATYTGMYSLVATATGAGLSTGQHRTAASYTAFTLYPTSGTMSGGTIRVYGYRNS